MTQQRSGGRAQASMRSKACWMRVRSPPRARNCLGRACRLRGQKRVPPPPAMIIAWSMRGSPPLGGLVVLGGSIQQRGRALQEDYGGLTTHRGGRTLLAASLLRYTPHSHESVAADRREVPPVGREAQRPHPLSLRFVL